MGGSIVKIKPILLNVLSVIALRVGEAEHPFLQDRIASIPEDKPEHQQLIAVADPGNGVFAPAIGFAACLVVSQVVPGITVGAVVLAHGSPGALAYIGPPLSPGMHRT